jgi:hypothetical protein
MIRECAVAASLFVFTVPFGAASGGNPPWQQASPTQTQSSAPAGASTPPATKPKSKKVWTNENVSDASGTISVVGSANSGSAGGLGPKTSPKPTAAGSVDPKVVASLRDQLHRLQAQLNIVERQYSELKAQSKGDSKSAGGLQANTFNYDSSSVEEQLRHLQEKKKRLEDAIDQLLDAARKAGIEPGDLR